MKRTFAVLLGLFFTGVFANSALATTWDPGGGYIEVCKAANPALTGSFQFQVQDSSGDAGATQTVVVPIGTCSQPLSVFPGSVTVTEQGALTGLTNQGTVSTSPDTSFISATTTAVGPSGPLPGGTGFTYVATVPASPNGTSNVVTVTYHNTLVTGVVEVCKQIVTGSGLTGSWQFTITGGNGFSQLVSVPSGSCSDPITVPAGKVKVQETGDLAESVTNITATMNAGSTNAIIGPDAGPAADLPAATVVAAVTPGDASKQTLVTMWNDSVTLKLCKYVDDGLTPSNAASTYSFTFPSVTGNAGPTGPIAPVSLAPGGSFKTAICTVVGTFRAGTTVQIVEGITAGEKVGSISVSPTNPNGAQPPSETTIVPGSLSLPNRTVTVVLGGGETDVTYENIPALPGTLKLCKISATGTGSIAAGTLFPFTITPPSGPATTVSVPTGSCVVVSNNYSFDETLSVSEGTVPGISTTVQQINTNPPGLSVVVLENPANNESCPAPAGTGATNTNQASLTNVNLSGRSASVTIGECNTTEVDFTNVDPPNSTGGNTGSGGVTSGGGGSSSTSSGGGGSSSSSSGGGGGSSSSSSGGGSSSNSSSSTSSGSNQVAPTTGLSNVPTGIGIGIGVAAGSGKASETKAELLKALKVAKLDKELTTLKAELKRLVHKHATATTLAVRHALAKQITALEVNEALLAKEIKQLKK